MPRRHCPISPMKARRRPVKLQSKRAPQLGARQLVLGVDGGGSKTRAVVADGVGEVLGEGLAGPSNPLRVGVARGGGRHPRGDRARLRRGGRAEGRDRRRRDRARRGEARRHPREDARGPRRAGLQDGGGRDRRRHRALRRDRGQARPRHHRRHGVDLLRRQRARPARLRGRLGARRGRRGERLVDRAARPPGRRARVGRARAQDRALRGGLRILQRRLSPKTSRRRSTRRT